ncbi:hypothetical protein Tco_0671095 [Tanacetum coccineum]
MFRVFQNLCKQGDWFSFAKHRAPSPVCIDDNRSCKKHWKSGFFFIHRRAIPNVMVWRHPDAAIDDLRSAAGSFNMVDVCRLSAHVLKLRDMPEGVLVLSGLSRVWKSRVCDPVLRGANGNVMGIHDFLCLPEWTGAEVQEEPHLDVRSTLQRLPFYCTPPVAANAVILDPTPEDLAIGSTTRPSLFAGDDDESDDDDDDACVKILLVTPLCSAAVIPSSGNQGGSSATPTTEDSRGKGVMVDDAAVPSAGASRPRPSFGPAPSFRNVSGDAIHSDFFPFSAGPYCATYPEDVVDGNYSRLNGYEENVASLTGLELQVSALKKQVARLSAALNQATVLEAEKDEEILWLKATPLEFSSFFHGQFQGLVRKFLASDEFSIVQGELFSIAASAGFERGLSTHQTKDEFGALEPKKLVRPTNVLASKEVRVSPPTKESTVTPVSKSLELSDNVNFTASAIAHEHNEEMVNAEVDGSDPKMTNDTVAVKSGHAFVQGISVALDDAMELVEVGSGSVSFGPNDVVVALAAGEKGDGLDPSSAAGEEAAANPSRV